jgi:hypothetical protein
MFFVDPYTLQKLRDFEESRLVSAQTLHREHWLRRQDAVLHQRHLVIARRVGARFLPIADRLRPWAGVAALLGNGRRSARSDERREALHAATPTRVAITVEAVERARQPLRPPVELLAHGHADDADRLAG